MRKDVAVASGWLGLDWGNVPTWVGAVITGTSASIAAIAYRRSVRDKERDQASHVAAWVGLTDGSDGGSRMLHITNGSDASVYEVSVQVPGAPDFHLVEIPAKTTLTPDVALPEWRETGRDVAVTTVTAKVRFFLMSVEGTAVAEAISQEAAPTIEFRDAVGRRWQRSAAGKLSQVTESGYRITEWRARYGLPFLGSVELERSRPPTPTPSQSAQKDVSSGTKTNA